MDSTSTGTLLVGGVTVLLLVYLMSKRKSIAKLPRGPPGLPIYGNLLDLKRSTNRLPGVLDEWAEQYGDVYYLQLGHYPAIVLNSLEAIKEAFLKNGDKTSGRPNNVFLMRTIMRNDKYGIIMSDGQLWRDIRRTTLHSMRDFGMGKKSMELRIQEEASALMQHFNRFDNKAFDPKFSLHNAFTNVIISIVFGERYEYDDPEFEFISEKLTSLLNNGGFKCPETFIPILTPFIPLISKDLFKRIRCRRELDTFIMKTIKNRSDQFDPENIRNFIDIYLNEKKNAHHLDDSPDDCLFVTILDLFIAGSETSMTTTRWALLYLIHYPEVQAKCQQVIKEIIGQERIPSMADRNKLTYVEATIFEIQRLASIAPLGLLHRATDTLELLGYIIPKDTLIVPNLYHIHMDPRYWKDPEHFNPERWIGPDGSLLKHEAFIPFSIGPRECLGKNLALQEIFIFLVSLLQRFTVKAKDPQNLPKLAGNVGVLYSPNDFEIVLQPVQ